MEPFAAVIAVAAGIVGFLLVMTAIISLLMVSISTRALKGEAERQLNAAAELLPGKDCSACGYGTCRDYARAMLQGESSCDKCALLTIEAASELREDVESMTHREELPDSIRERKQFLRRLARRSNQDEKQEEEEW